MVISLRDGLKVKTLFIWTKGYPYSYEILISLSSYSHLFPLGWYKKSVDDSQEEV